MPLTLVRSIFGHGCTFSTDNRRESRCFGGLSKEQLAGGPRARLKKQPTSQVPKSVVNAWLKKAKSSFGIRSIICLLMMVSFDYPEVFAMGLLSCYRTRNSGLNTFQSTTTTILRSPMTSCRRFGKRTSGSESQCCSIAAPGIGRSGKAVSYIKRKLEN